MTQHLNPTNLHEGDTVTLAGRTETVTRTRQDGDWVRVNVIGDGGDPYMVRPHDTVPVHDRA